MPREKFYLTTPIYYVNDVPHIGHAYTTIAADVLARYKRLAGYEVFFLTGTDEHGIKIERSARERGVSPQEWVDTVSAQFRQLWARLNISYDDFIRTSQGRHKAVAQAVFQKAYEKGDIYKSLYEGWYCIPDETFLLESELRDGQCPICGRLVEWITEEAYFFRLSKYQDWILEHIDTHPTFIQPVSRRNEVLSFVRSGLRDLCVSRSTFTWGIPVPFDASQVIYVWIDALTNYLTAIGYASDPSTFQVLASGRPPHRQRDSPLSCSHLADSPPLSRSPTPSAGIRPWLVDSRWREDVEIEGKCHRSRQTSGGVGPKGWHLVRNRRRCDALLCAT
jgi:methionyl-tRNA synthetase